MSVKLRLRDNPFLFWCARADNHVKNGSKRDVNDMLCDVDCVTMKCATREEETAKQLELAKYLVEKCGATKFERAAKNTIKLPIMKYFISLGASNFNAILNASDHTLDVVVYLINKGAKYEYRDACKDKDVEICILKAGGGRLLTHYPELLTCAEAKPYLQRKLDIAVILYGSKIKIPKDVIKLILKFVLYEIFITAEQFAEAERLYDKYTEYPRDGDDGFIDLDN